VVGRPVARDTTTALGRAVVKVILEFALVLGFLTATMYADLWLYGWLFCPELEYALRYTVHIDRVKLMLEPPGCSFDNITTGKKNCLYKPVVTVSEDQKQRRVVFVDWVRRADL
jgi:hypothetical protein